MSKVKDPTLYYRSFPMKPSRGDLKRLQIVEASIKCIAEHGLESAIFDRVAEALKTNRSHIVYYFPEREELLAMAIQYAVSTVQEFAIESLEKVETPEDKVLAMSDAAFLWTEKFPHHARLLLLFHFYSSKDGGHRKMQIEYRNAGAKRIYALLKEAFDKLSDRTLEQYARILQSIMTGFLIDLQSGPKLADSSYSQLSRRACETLLQAWKLNK